MARKRNFDLAKRREWAAEARREKAIELHHNSIIRQADHAERQNRLMSENQAKLIRKYKMHEFFGLSADILNSYNVKQASDLIDQYAKLNWKPRKPTKKVNNRPAQKKADTSTYQPWKSSDIKVTNIKTGEIKIIPNTTAK
jgi:hypothetical protein